MNINLILGLLIGLWVVADGVIRRSANPSLFFDVHAILIVGLGTIAAALIASPPGRLRAIAKFIITGAFFRKERSKSYLIKTLISAHAHILRTGSSRVVISEEIHPFLKEGIDLIREGHLNSEEFKEVLELRVNHFKRSYGEDAKSIAAIAKFPPAFGLLGAASGMISLMSQLGSGGKESIGPAMATAMVATFWGVGVANFLLLPLSDYANRLGMEDVEIRNLMVHGLLLIHQREKPMVLKEKLVSFLRINEREEVDAHFEAQFPTPAKETGIHLRSGA
jgi:chemotaxis protein MotA